jgi:NtrC-family two-component system sensor histidine kinase KinB
LNRVVDQAIRESQETIDLCAELHSSLEREDDALLLFLSGEVEHARHSLQAERRRGDARFEKLLRLIGPGSEQDLARTLRQQIDRYRAAGDALLDPNGRSGGLEQYHVLVNPLLRAAVAGCDRLREANFQSMEKAGVRARDEAARGTRFVVGIGGLMVALGVAVAVWLARSVLGPVKELTDSIEEIRRGNFDRRVRHLSGDELGELGAGFNRMAEALADYRRSSLGDLLAAKMTLEATLNALPDAVFVFGPDATLAALNPQAERILAARGCAAAARLEELPLPAELVASVRAALAGQPSPARQMDFAGILTIALDGRERRFLWTAVPIAEFAPRRFGAVVVLDDVTEFARLDELRSELIGVASHELKSPLTTLQMNLLMLRESASDLSERHRELVEAAAAGCEELGQTIDELLDVTRIEAGQLRLNPAPVELKALAAAVRKSLHKRFEDAGVQVTILAPPEPIVVLADARRLQSVLGNLLDNALKYSPLGASVLIEMASRQNAQVRQPGVVQIAVTDQGPSVPIEFRERIFEKFFRVEHHRGSRKKSVRGSGIGLYLCRQIVQSHGGTIHCEAGAAGVGTRFVLILPADL